MTTAKRVALYVRVSTSDQTCENQKRELRAWARAAGHKVICVFEDTGISGAYGRDKRPGFNAMLKAAVKREFDILAVWSSDRIGRSMPDLLEVLQTIRSTGTQLYLHTQGLDTTTPSGRALYQMLGAGKF
jgi:DNA invertase Pin-like site-specific DNA recombinase